jgi:hypothetical protein
MSSEKSVIETTSNLELFRLGVWAAIGLGYVWEQIAYLVGGAMRVKENATGKKPASVFAWPTRRGFMLAAPVLLIALIPLFANWQSASRAGHQFTDQWARDYLNSLEPYAIVVTHGDNDTFPLWYAQATQNVRRDITVGVSTYLTARVR